MINFHDVAAQKYWTFSASYKGDKKAETKNMIFGGDYIGSRKMDGAFYKFWKDEEGNMELLGRSKSVKGDYLNKINWVPQLQEFFDAIPNGSCLIGEIYFPDNEGSSNVTTIMGCLEERAKMRQERGDKLHYYVFDVLAWEGEDLLKTNIEERIKYLDLVSAIAAASTEYVEIAKYLKGEALWKELQSILANGGEGIVITKVGTCYQPGKRPARQTLKVKKELQENIDCFFTGRATAPTREYSGKEIESWKYWEDVKTGKKMEGEFYNDYFNGAAIEPVTKPYFNHWAGSLEIGVLKEGKITPIGFLSGLSDEIKSNFEDYKMKCIEVAAMEILPTGGIRHGKLMRFRPDLTIEECTWEKVFH